MSPGLAYDLVMDCGEDYWTTLCTFPGYGITALTEAGTCIEMSRACSVACSVACYRAGTEIDTMLFE